MNIKVLFDPLYGAVPFKLRRLGVDDFFYDSSTFGDADLERVQATGDYARKFAAILRTFEFSRLNFLKQAGFSWLIYPSATHTRYAHSLGCWYLAEQALECVKVRDQHTDGSHETFLIRWLDSRDLVEEFLLSMLLHDIGHFPFSHVLESNSHYAEIRHEVVGCQLIQGRGVHYEVFRDIILRQTSENQVFPRQVEFLSSALRKLDNVDVDVICALISKDLSYTKNKTYQVREAIPIMIELVSGLIDLDRIDHYHRDSHFMGLKVATVSPVALLANMIMIPEMNTDPPSARIELEEEGIMQVFSLLESRETLRNYVFENDHNVAYSAMLNAAVDIFLEEQQEHGNELLMWTDDHLLNQLSSYGEPRVAKLARMILCGSPYILIGKYAVYSYRKRTVEWIKDLKNELLGCLQIEHGLDVDDTDVLFALPRYYYSKVKLPSDDWFKLDDIYDSRGNYLKTQDKYARRIRYFKESLESAREAPLIHMFASNFEIKRHLEKEIVLKQCFQ